MKDKEYKVVFQLSSNDEQVCKSLLKQIGNVTKELSEIKMEIVTHGPGIELLLLNTRFINLLEEKANRGVRFLVCRNTLIEKAITASEIISVAEIIPSGIAHLIVRQSEGWSYIKAGF